MAIRAVIIDLDGTLLTSDKQVSKENERAFLKIKDSGMPIVVATARPPRMVDSYFPLTQEAESVIYFNGALVSRRGKPFGARYRITHADLVTIACFMETRFPDPYIIYEGEKDWFANRRLRADETLLYRRGQPVFKLPSIKRADELKEIDVYKILFDKHGGVQETFIERFGEHFNVGHMLGGNPVEVVNREASKEQAASGVLRSLGIDPADVAVFGDEHNDIGLFELCGHPVAMGNAIKELKDRAKRVTETNDDHGVAVTLRKILETGEV